MIFMRDCTNSHRVNVDTNIERMAEAPEDKHHDKLLLTQTNFDHNLVPFSSVHMVADSDKNN